jgi:hypothetical protein
MSNYDSAARALLDRAQEAAEAFKRSYLGSRPTVTVQDFIEAKALELRSQYQLERVEFDADFLEQFFQSMERIEATNGRYPVEELMNTWVDIEVGGKRPAWVGLC